VHFSGLPGIAEPGDIELIFLSSNAADSTLRTKGHQAADVNNRVVSFTICSIWHQKCNVPSLFHDRVLFEETRVLQVYFAERRRYYC
jgi:hypothetical protein